LDDQQLKTSIEALLFIAGSPLTLDRLKGIFEETPKEQIEAQLRALKEDYAARGAGVMLAEVANGWQLATCPDQAPWVRKFKTVKVTARLSRPALETLAIIAYKQPVTRAEVEAIRGVEVSNLIQNLLEKKMIRILGRAETAGRPLLYGTTHEFLIHFGLKDLSDMPKVSEIQELAGDRPSPEFLKEMEGELRRRETKLGLAPAPEDQNPSVNPDAQASAEPVQDQASPSEEAPPSGI